MATTDREVEEPVQCLVLLEPRTCDRPIAIQECSHDLGANIGDGHLWPDNPAKRLKQARLAAVPCAERPAKGYVMCDQLVEVHAKPSRSKSPTARRPTRSTLA